jgi:hypothetical protein
MGSRTARNALSAPLLAAPHFFKLVEDTPAKGGGRQDERFCILANAVTRRFIMSLPLPTAKSDDSPRALHRKL